MNNVDVSIFDPAKCNRGEGIMSYISFNFVYQSVDGVEIRTEGVALASKKSGEPTVLFDLRVHKKGDRCTECEKHFKCPTLAHTEEKCPVKTRAPYINTDVLTGHQAGVRNAPGPPRQKRKCSGWQLKNLPNRKKKKNAGYISVDTTPPKSGQAVVSQVNSDCKSVSTNSNSADSEEPHDSDESDLSENPDVSERTYECGNHPGVSDFGSEVDEYDGPETNTIIAFESEAEWPTFRLGQVFERFYSADASDFVHVQYYGFSRSIQDASKEGSEYIAKYELVWRPTSSGPEVQSSSHPGGKYTKWWECIPLDDLVAADVELNRDGTIKKADQQVIRENLV